MTMTDHAALMDQTYRYQRRIYDATRAFYLLGRDHLIAELAPPAGGRVLEIACGTGRNLALIARRYPQSDLYGLDISQQMLRSAAAKLGPRARLAQGDACDFDPQALFGTGQFERIIFSYSLSMIPDWQGALAHAAGHLTADGSLHVVDFGRQTRLPALFRRGLNTWLARFHVSPRHDLAQVLGAIAAARGRPMRSADLFGSYAQWAVLTPAT